MREAPRRAGDVNEAALLEAARELVQRGEFQTTPIGQITQRAGISRQGFYFYYQSKDELLAQLVTETLYGSQPWRETLYSRASAQAAAAVRELIAATLVMWRQNRAVLAAAVELGPRAPVVMAQWGAIVDETADFLTEMCVASTTIEALRDPGAARSTIVALIWLVERNCYMHVVQGGDEADAVISERLSDIWIRALGLDG